MRKEDVSEAWADSVSPRGFDEGVWEKGMCLPRFYRDGMDAGDGAANKCFFGG
jgi:hypothetical protein